MVALGEPMHATPLGCCYAVVLQAMDGSRLFCASRLTDEWTGYFWRAERFASLHEAEKVASRHGAMAMAWSEAYELARSPDGEADAVPGLASESAAEPA